MHFFPLKLTNCFEQGDVDYCCQRDDSSDFKTCLMGLIGRIAMQTFSMKTKLDCYFSVRYSGKWKGVQCSLHILPHYLEQGYSVGQLAHSCFSVSLPYAPSLSCVSSWVQLWRNLEHSEIRQQGEEHCEQTSCEWGTYFQFLCSNIIWG